jgi:hypothetical protein
MLTEMDSLPNSEPDARQHIETWVEQMRALERMHGPFEDSRRC